MKLNAFIKKNKEFWTQRTPGSHRDDLLLVETNSNPVINHSNAIVGKIVAESKNLRVSWLLNPSINKDLLASYDRNSIFIEQTSITFIEKLWLLFQSIYFYLFFTIFLNKTLYFTYKNINYGDFIYDNYLSMFSQATLHRFDTRLIKTYFQLLIKDNESRKLLNNHSIKAVLISHFIGFGTGVLTRVALSQNIPAYWKGGGHNVINLAVFVSLSDIYNFPKRPTSEKIDLLTNNKKNLVKKDFEKYKQKLDIPHYGVFAAIQDYSQKKTLSKKGFIKKYKLENKPIVFVMQHVFNDHPHSHFKSMLFNDYYDWFNQTLEFAKTDSSKNWVFKEHPANKYYPTKDIDLKKHFENVPSNILFLDCDTKITGSAVLELADLVVTCLGTAGLEMPAFKGIPSLLGGDSAYSDFGFTIDPKTKKEYFNALSQTNFPKLSQEQQLKAQACYMYFTKYCMLPFSAGPEVTFEESKHPHTLRDTYYAKVLHGYKTHKQAILNEFDEYVKEISKPKFAKLERLPS